MYVTSQRVLREHTGQTGINTFVFKHGPEPIDHLDWAQPDAGRIADQVPGLLAGQEVDVPVGGNLIRSWLDVACRDETSDEAISQALQRFRSQWRDDLLSKSVPIGPIAIRFGVQLSERDLPAELELLSARIMTVLARPGMGALPSEPLQIAVNRSGGTLSFALSDTSVERLKAIHRHSWSPHPVSVGIDAAADLQSQYGLEEPLVPILTGLPLERVVQLGGVQFIEEGSGRVRWETLPRTVLVGGYCLACHQQHTLTHAPDGRYRCGFCGYVQDNDGTWVGTLT